MRKLIAVFLCAALTATGCATPGGPRVRTGPVDARHVQDRAVLVEYVQRLTPGAAVRVQLVDGTSVRGVLMKATDASVILQQRTRVPEPAVEIAMADIASVTPDTGGGASLARAIGAGAAAGAGAALAVFFFLVSIYD